MENPGNPVGIITACVWEEPTKEKALSGRPYKVNAAMW
jgi:hypothetical protein